MQIFDAAVAVLFRFRQIVHDPFPDQMPCQQLSPASLLCWRLERLRITLRLGSSWFFDDFFRLTGLPEFLKQSQLIFRELFAFAVCAAHPAVRAAGSGTCPFPRSRASVDRTDRARSSATHQCLSAECWDRGAAP